MAHLKHSPRPLFPNGSRKQETSVDGSAERPRKRLAYQAQLLFMEFQVNGDKIEKKGERCWKAKVNEVKGFVFILRIRYPLLGGWNLNLNLPTYQEKERESRMIGRLVGQKEMTSTWNNPGD